MRLCTQATFNVTCIDPTGSGNDNRVKISSNALPDLSTFTACSQGGSSHASFKAPALTQRANSNRHGLQRIHAGRSQHLHAPVPLDAPGPLWMAAMMCLSHQTDTPRIRGQLGQVSVDLLFYATDGDQLDSPTLRVRFPEDGPCFKPAALCR